MSKFATLVTEDIRLAILQILEGDIDYAVNDRIIKSALGQLSHNISSDKLKTELAWLEEQHLITVQKEPVLVAKLTVRGEDVALGHARVPGVARLRPE